MRYENAAANGRERGFSLTLKVEQFTMRRLGSGNFVVATFTTNMEYKRILKLQTSAADPFVINGKIVENEDKIKTEEF